MRVRARKTRERDERQQAILGLDAGKNTVCHSLRDSHDSTSESSNCIPYQPFLESVQWDPIATKAEKMSIKETFENKLL
jgi:hypothetical protein